ncbi:MAG: Holliday junction branch migration protein RuvA [Lachnospiraceae bacterium]
MIAFIKGEVASVHEHHIILENQNMGYCISMPANTIQSEIRQGKHYKIYTQLVVKEDDLSLYGFLTQQEVQTFLLLTNISGIGPKAAMGIMSNLTASELTMAVFADDIAAISKAPGIGKKMAGKVIFELKDKINLEDTLPQTMAGSSTEPEEASARSEAIQALLALGYSNSEAVQAISKVETDSVQTTQEWLKAALKKI